MLFTPVPSGVQAASRTYFSKDVKDISLAQAALRGDKPRLVWNTIKSLEKLRALDAEIIITGHGEAKGIARKRLKLLRFRHAEALVAGDFDEMTKLLKRHLG